MKVVRLMEMLGSQDPESEAVVTAGAGSYARVLSVASVPAVPGTEGGPGKEVFRYFRDDRSKERVTVII